MKGLSRRSDGQRVIEEPNGSAQWLLELPTEAVTSIDAKYLSMPNTRECARGSLPGWRASLGSLSVTAVRLDSVDGVLCAAAGICSGIVVSVLLGAVLLLLLSLPRLARAHWTHSSARAEWAVEGAAAARLQRRARTRGARLRLRAARAAAVLLQREVRRWLARRGLLEAAAAGVTMDARTFIRALLLHDHDHAPKGESILGDHAPRGCRVPGGQLSPHAALEQPTRAAVPKAVPKVPRVHELQALQGVRALQALHPLQGLQGLLSEPDAATTEHLAENIPPPPTMGSPKKKARLESTPRRASAQVLGYPNPYPNPNPSPNPNPDPDPNPNPSS